MQEIICYSDYLPEGTERTVSFMQLLLDDNWAKGELLFSEAVYSEIGGKNTKLTAKQNYEFLLRAVQKYPLKVTGRKTAYSEVSEEKKGSEWEGFRTDCYVAGRYSQELQDSGILLWCWRLCYRVLLICLIRMQLWNGLRRCWHILRNIVQ